MKTPTTKPAADAIDIYIAREYLAQVRGEPTGSFTSRLLAMAEEARVIDPAGQAILQEVARKMAEWEMGQE